MKHINPVSHLCPFLGLQDDADSLVAFPSNLNYCHHGQPISSIRFNHQEEFCLGKKHLECPVFLQEQAAPQSGAIGAYRAQTKVSQKKLGKSLVVLFVILTIFGVLGWTFTGKTPPAIQATASHQIVLPASNTPTYIYMPAVDDYSTATPSLPPTLTGTPTLHVPFFGSVTVTSSVTMTPSTTPTTFVSRHQADIPVGMDRKFVIHRLAKGESLDPHVKTYNTSVEAVKALNYYLYLTNPVRRDVLIVFPINFEDVSGMHVLIIYQVKELERGINIEDLAKHFHVNLKDFKYYNGITEAGDRPLVGDYFLIPHERLVP